MLRSGFTTLIHKEKMNHFYKIGLVILCLVLMVGIMLV
jgi:hypothetical protein